MLEILDEGVVPVDYQNAGLNTALHYAAANGYPYTLHTTHYILHPTPYNLRPTHYTLEYQNAGLNTALHYAAANG